MGTDAIFQTRTAGPFCRSIFGRWFFSRLAASSAVFERVHPPDAAGHEHRHAQVALPALQVFHPWYLNIPLVTWLALRGRCKNCGRAHLRALFRGGTAHGVAFLSCWLVFGDAGHPLPSMPVALVYAVFLAGLIAATFIDFEHFIIPDEITLGGMVAGFAASFFLPSLQGATTLNVGWGGVLSAQLWAQRPFTRFCGWANCCLAGNG